MTSIDLNADLGEECADDEAMLAIVTTANVAAGGHAGGGDVLTRTVAEAVRGRVSVGAHPSYLDREGFGRTSLLSQHDPQSLRALVREQSREVARACAEHGTVMTHVKAHGALYHDAGRDPVVAEAFVEAVLEVARESGSELAIMGAAGSTLHRTCEAQSVRFIAEAFADRTYAADGSLIPRSAVGAVRHDVEDVVQQALMIAIDGYALALDGSQVRVEAQTLCVHGDTPDSVRLASRVRVALEEAGLVITHPLIR